MNRHKDIHEGIDSRSAQGLIWQELFEQGRLDRLCGVAPKMLLGSASDRRYRLRQCFLGRLSEGGEKERMGVYSQPNFLFFLPCIEPGSYSE